ncbi:TetR/AcrR family transcriptional regulator [Kutzneria chonburiensis]|uniref:TetR/AcrR family transcriptional regulator n=1 Tax=Kutzneria chonburiensis TaxID=1483604 RepID=A0ABV6N0L1_9PSEU|nr:TetR/AcrR family transcriptional regulator [Kutzneria chonburiensis]
MPSITRRAPNPERRASADAEILAATRRLLDGGATFTELGVQHISAEAGVARSTFYAHFKDKTALLLRLAGDMVETSFGVASAWEPDSGVAGLTEAFQQVVAIYRDNITMVLAVAEVSAYDATVRDFWSGLIAPFSARTVQVLEQEQAAGRTPSSVDVVNATRVIVMGGEKAIVDHVLAGDPDQDEAFARELALIWWHGAYRRP